MKPGDDGLKGIAEMAPPTNYNEIQRFLGATGFFQRFIKNYAQIARPLYDLLEGETSKSKAQPVNLPPEALEALDHFCDDHPQPGCHWTLVGGCTCQI